MADGCEATTTPFAFLSEEDTTEFGQLFDQGGINACDVLLHKKAEQWKTVPINIGLVGSEGTGKSSFINALRGLTADDEGAAKVGTTKTTLEPVSYAHPSNPLLTFWDLPGVPISKLPREEYAQQVGLDSYDFYLIISCDRFTENDQWLTTALSIKEKRFFYIRTKIHNSVEANRHVRQENHGAERVLDQIRNNLSNNLGALYVENEVFLIDSHKPDKYNFDDLGQRLVEIVPSVKRSTFLRLVSALCERMVKAKVQKLGRYIWASSIFYGYGAPLPIVGLSVDADDGFLIQRSIFFFKELGLDDESLRKTAQILGCDVNHLNKMVADYQDNFFTVHGIQDLILKNPIANAAIATQKWALSIPLVGSVVAAPLSCWTTAKALNAILTKMEENALLVVKAAIGGSSNLD